MVQDFERQQASTPPAEPLPGHTSAFDEPAAPADTRPTNRP
jgi:hypothetical protein